jgi:hypothetical protein
MNEQNRNYMSSKIFLAQSVCFLQLHQEPEDLGTRLCFISLWDISVRNIVLRLAINWT